MGYEITVDSRGVEGALGGVSKDMNKILRACVLQATNILYIESRVQLSRIYNIPVPVGKRSGKPLWEQTSTLKRNEMKKFHAIGRAAVGLVYNNTPYAYWREQMNTVGKYGNRIVHWRDDTITAKGEEAVNVFAGKFDAELKERGL